MTLFRAIVSRKQDLIGLLLVTLPILIYWAYWTAHPSYWFNADPAAVYFIDSLAPFIGKHYVFVDHPGTPIQIIGSILLALTYPFFESREAFIQFFLSRPNAFFLMTNVFLLCANLICAIVFYKTVSTALTKYRILGALSLSLLFFTLHTYSFSSMTLWSHNSLNYPFGTLILLWLFRETREPKDIKPARLILMGLACGILAVAQMYFLAWLAGAIATIFFFSYRINRKIITALRSAGYVTLGGISGIATMLAPIFNELPRFLNWIGEIVTHTGLYGTGESGFISISLIQSSLVFWWAFIRPMFVLTLITLFVAMVLHLRGRKGIDIFSAGDQAMIAGLAVQIALIFLVMIKATIKLRYSLSLAATLPVLVFIVLKILETSAWKVEKLQIPFYGLILIGVVFSLTSQKPIIDERHRVEGIIQNAKDQAVNQLAKRMNMEEEDIVVVNAYAVPLKCAGLLQGSNWTGNFEAELLNICPNQHAVWDTIVDLNTAVPVKNISDIEWDMVIWPGNGSNLPEYLNAVGAVNVPRSWHVEYSKWFFIRPEFAEK